MKTNELAQLVLWDTESDDDPVVMVTLPVNPDLDLTSKLEAVILHAVKEVYPCPESWTMAQVLAEYMGNTRGPLYEFSSLLQTVKSRLLDMAGIEEEIWKDALKTFKVNMGNIMKKRRTKMNSIILTTYDINSEIDQSVHFYKDDNRSISEHIIETVIAYFKNQFKVDIQPDTEDDMEVYSMEEYPEDIFREYLKDVLGQGIIITVIDMLSQEQIYQLNAFYNFDDTFEMYNALIASI